MDSSIFWICHSLFSLLSYFILIWLKFRNLPGKITCFLPSASGLYMALRNIFLFWLTKLQMLWVCFLTSFCCLSFSELYKKVPKRHEYKWSKIKVRKCSLNSKACGNCERTCQTQSINCRKTGDLQENTEILVSVP